MMHDNDQNDVINCTQCECVKMKETLATKWDTCLSFDYENVQLQSNFKVQIDKEWTNIV